MTTHQKIAIILCAWRGRCKRNAVETENMRQAILSMRDEETIDNVYKKLMIDANYE